MLVAFCWLCLTECEKALLFLFLLGGCGFTPVLSIALFYGLLFVISVGF